MMRAARLVVGLPIPDRLVWSRRTQPSDQGWATPTPNLLVPVPNRSIYAGVLMRDAPSVQSEFHRVGWPAAAGGRCSVYVGYSTCTCGWYTYVGSSGVGFQGTRYQNPSLFLVWPFASSWPFVSPVSSGRLYGHLCQSSLLCLQYSLRAAVPSAHCSAHTASGPSVPGFRIRRPSGDLVSQSQQCSQSVVVTQSQWSSQ